MSHVVRQDIDALNAQIIVTLTADDYGKKIKDQIKKYSQNAQIKGFRPGKTPPSLIQKMYGKSFMVDIVNNEINEHLSKFMEAHKEVMFMGQPILSLEQEPMSLSLENPKDVVTRFDIGIEPVFELQGLDESTKLSFFDVQVPDSLVEEEVARIRKQAATEQTLNSIKYENDYITVNVVFEKDGETKENSFGILAQDLTEEARAVFNTKVVGNKFTFNLYNLEQESTDDNVKTYFLGLTKEDDVTELGTDFEIEIKSIMNRKEADLDQAFFDKYFGEGQVSSEEEMYKIIRQVIFQQQYLGTVEGLLFRDLQQVLMEKNPIELPQAFLKRWLMSVDKKNTPELVEADFDKFAENLKWTIIRRKIIAAANIQVTDEGLRNYYKMRVRGYLGGVENEQLENMMADRLMEDEKQFNDLLEDFLTDAAFNYARLKVELIPLPISAEEFKTLTAALSNKNNADEEGEPLEVVAEEIGA